MQLFYMKTLYYLFLIFSFSTKAFAQDDDTFSEAKLQSIANNMKQVWNDPDPDFSVSAVPDKWKEESGVIIAQKTRFSFDKDASKLAVYEITRRRIKLIDRDAVNSYSSVYFRIGSSNDGAGIKIIKSNGTVQDVSLRNAIYIEDNREVPSTFAPYIGKADTYRDKSKSRVTYYKVAVPDLDPGDIIDYGTIFYDDNTVKKMNFIEFDPIYYVCTREYPLIAQKFEIDTDDKSFVNSKSTMGAPEFKETTNSNADYAWEDRNRDKASDTRWVNSLVELPMIKFQIVFSKQENRSDLFIGDKGELKQNISPEELAKKMNNLYNRLDGSMYYTLAKGYLKQISATDMRDEDFIQKAYYILRHMSFYRAGGFSSELFASCLTQCLDLKKIPYDLIVTSPANVCKPENIIFRTEPEWMVRVKGKYIFNASIVSNPYDFKEEFLNTQAYIISLGKNPTATPVTLPGTIPEENITTNSITATMDTATRNMNIVLQRAVIGLSKQFFNQQALSYTPALDDDHRSYGGEDDVRGGMKGDALEAYETRLRERKKEDKTNKLEYMKNELEDDYESLTAYTEFTLNTDGRTWRKQELNYTNKFELGDMVKVAGDNLLVSVPGLIGDQLWVSQDERKREVDAYMSFPRSTRNIINFSIPAGYKAVGVQNLNMNIDNEAGTFAVQASVEGNTLNILVKKLYKQMTVKKENWPKLMEMLDAAFNFSQKKILLKRM
ncbi:MAG: hypothetical protein HZB42_09890 [Sphingobacteriales bacterium]|nr:hypothetical protein [Sphingobacteriales bacterium]